MFDAEAIHAQIPSNIQPNYHNYQVPLSGRERTILRGLAQGRSTAEMAAELVVSANTIKTQVSSPYHKLNVHSREEALAEATRLHLL